MIDHVSIGVRDLERSAAFYDRVLGAIGYVRLVERPCTIGFGKKHAEFWLNLREGDASLSGDGTHICLRARDAATVNGAHTAALSLGGVDDEAPGSREYALGEVYAAFFRDMDGHRIEIITFPQKTGTA